MYTHRGSEEQIAIDPQNLRSAYSTSTLIKDVDGKIECLCLVAQRVVIGMNDGRIILYDTRRSKCQQVSSKSFPHKKRIDQIIGVAHIRTVLVLSDGQVTAHSLSDLELLPSALGAVRGVQVFCVNQRGPPHFRICVAVKKKIVLFEYVANEKKYNFLREHPLNDTPQALAWYRNVICAGYRKEYQIVNDKSGETTTLKLSIDHRSTLPLTKMLPGEEIIVAAMERVGVLVNFKGEPLPKNSVAWSNTPTALQYSFPYLVAMMPRAGLEIHSMRDQALVQVISLPKVCAIAGDGLKWDMEPKPPGHVDDFVIVATSNPSQVLRLDATPYEQQIAELLDRGNAEEAFVVLNASIAGLSAEKQRSCVKRFHKRAGVALLRRLRFDSAIEYFMQSEIDPRELIAFFPDLQSKSFAYQPVILKPEVLPRPSNAPPDMVGVIAEAQRRRLGPDSSSKKLLVQATNNLLGLLEHYRTAYDQRVDPRVVEAVDTALLRLYVEQGKRRELELMLAQPTEVDLGDAQKLLLSRKLFHELAVLYSSRGEHRQALDIWSRLGTREYIQPGCDGVDPTIELLKVIDDVEIVWMYSPWVLRSYPDRGQTIFTESKRTPPLPVHRVLEHLKTFPDSGLSRQYLEYVVYNNADVDASHHTDLAMEYLDEAIELMKSSGERITPAFMQAKETLRSFLDYSTKYDVDKLMSRIEKTPLQKEFILLCGKSGAHSSALRSLVYEKRDPGAAETYCLKHGGPENAHTARLQANEALMELLEIYMDPEDESLRQVFKDNALRLIRRHATRMDALRVFAILPDDTLVSELGSVLQQILPNSEYKMRQGMLSKSLSNINNLYVQCDVVAAKRQAVEIQPETLCRVCHKRIGDIVFAAYPNGVVTHYKCTRGKLNTCPITMENFS